MLHVVTTGAYYPPVVTTWKILTTGASQLTAVSLCTALQQYVNQYGKQPDSIVSTVANQAFQKHFFPYVLLQLLLLSRWVTRSLRVQLNLCGGPSPPHKFFPDPQNLQDWRTANFFQMSPLLYDGINERYCFLLRVLLPLILFPLVSIRLTKQ